MLLSTSNYSIFFSLMPSSSSNWRMTKYMSAQPTMKPKTIPIKSLWMKQWSDCLKCRDLYNSTLIPYLFCHREGRVPCTQPWRHRRQRRRTARSAWGSHSPEITTQFNCCSQMIKCTSSSCFFRGSSPFTFSLSLLTLPVICLTRKMMMAPESSLPWKLLPTYILSPPAPSWV